MFTFLGKMLVLLYGAAAIGCLMGAVAVVTQKMDYVTPRGGEAGKKTLNRVEQAQAAARDLLAANQRAVTRLRLEMEPLVENEIEHLERRDYYYGQMQMMLTGNYYGPKGAPVKGFKTPKGDPLYPVQQIDPDKDFDKDTGLLKIHIDQTKPPARRPVEVFANGMKQPIRTSNEYVADLKTVNGDIAKKLEDIEKLIAAHAAATLAINGSQAVKGLRDKIKEQIRIMEDALAETEFLEDYVSRREAEAELFVKRRDAMAARLVELKKFFKIKDEPGVPGN